MKENEMVKIGGKLFRQFAPIDFDGNQWLRTTQLAKMFSLTRSTIWKFVGLMETEPRYKNSILHVSPRATLIKGRDFLAYLQDRNRNYMRGRKKRLLLYFRWIQIKKVKKQRATGRFLKIKNQP